MFDSKFPILTLSENEKRVLITLVVLILLVFVIVGYIGLLVEKTMKKQGKRASTMMYDVVTAKVVTTEKGFRRLGHKKNNQLFARQATPAFLILTLAGIIYIINGAISKTWLFNLFDKDTGFGSVMWLWDFAHVKRVQVFGMWIIADWPPLLNTPHFVAAAWASYIIVPCLFVGGTWLLVTTQAHIARAFKLKRLAKTVFNPSLETPEFNQNKNDAETTPTKGS
ncbi:MAG: hypothetical protein MJ206_00620 [Bacilli bacterium]|nr:hypothetical protein [Bacilli bacterium]